MKKFLSFMLVLVMIASMMCINVAAAEFVGPNFVGTHGGSEGIDNGVVADQDGWTQDDFNVNAKLQSTVKNRYAVDLTFAISDITISGDSTWNVESLQYEGDITLKALETIDAEEDADGNSAADVKVGEFTMTNYSDLAVEVEIAVDVPMATYAPVTAAVYTSSEKVFEDNRALTPNDTVLGSDAQEIAGAYDDEANGLLGGAEAKKHYFTAYVSSTDWAHVVSQLSNTAPDNDTVYRAASFTFTVKPAAGTTPSQD